MAKRISAFFLILAIVFCMIPATAFAAQLTPTTINVLYDGITHETQVYRCGDDLYFSADDLYAYTYYEYDNNGKKATFTRGAKKIIIDLKDDAFTVESAGTHINRDWTNAPVQIDGQWYFSGAELLPWLNVTCGTNHGALVIVPDAYSFWDIYAELDYFSFCIDYSTVCMELAWDSKVVKALKFTDDHLGKTIMEGINIEDEYGGSAEDYYDLFEGFLLDKSRTAAAAEQIHDYYDLGLDVMGVLFPGCSDLFKAMSIYNDGSLYASNYAAFTQDDSNKMDAIHTVFSSNYGTQQLNDGANLTILAYESWWSNILTNLVLDLDDHLIDFIKDKITSGIPMADALLLAVDVATKEQQSLNKRIKLMAPTLNLYGLGSGLLDGEHSAHVVSLEASEQKLVIGLYAAAENAQTLADYCKDKELYNLADKYAAQAKNALAWIEAVNAASLCLANDSIHYYNENGEPDQDVYKDAYTDSLLKLFGKLDQYEQLDPNVSTVEYAMLHTYLLRQSIAEPTWKIVRHDDGSDLYVLYGHATDGDTEAGICFTADASTENAQAYLTEDREDCADPNLTDFVLSGKADALYKALDAHFSHRSGYVTTLDTDLNGEGKKDRVYGLVNAMQQWSHRFELRGDKDINPFRTDGDVTLVTAEQVGGGLRIRVTHLPAADSKNYTFADGALTIGSDSYLYQPEGTAFVPNMAAGAADMALFDLLLLTPEQVQQVVKDYDAWSADESDIYVRATFRGIPLELHFEPIQNTFRCTNLDIVFEGKDLAVTRDLNSTASVEEAMDYLQPTISWNLYKSESVGNSAHYYHSNFYYDDVTKTAWFVLINAETPWDNEKDGWGDRVFAGISFSYTEDMTQETPDWLISAYPDR